MSDACFVFGSNLLGIHGAGAAYEARRNWGATMGTPSGLQGDSFQGYSYAIPTKHTPETALPLSEIVKYVKQFLKFADRHPEFLFILTPIGCGLAGYTPKDIAPMFVDAPKNVYLPKEFVNEMSR